jgi:hypothetical protein
MADEFEQYRVSSPPDEFEQYRVPNDLVKSHPGSIGTLTRPLDILKQDIESVLPTIGKLIKEGTTKNLYKEPLERIKDIGAGSTGLLKNILNLPHDIPSLLSHFEMIQPQTSEKISKYIPKFEEKEFVKNLFGQATTPESKLTRGAIENLPLILGGLKSVSKIRPPAILRKVDFEKPISELQNKYDLIKSLNEKSFTDIENEAYKRGTDRIDNTFDIVEKIEDKNYLPETEETDKLLAKAKMGDYKSLRELQADLGNLGYSDISHKLSINRNRGREMISLQNKINDAIYNHLKNEGHLDLAEKLKNTRNEYRNIMEKYHPTGKKATTATRAISKMVGENKVIPKSPETIFSEKSIPMDKFRKEHPEIVEMLGRSRNKKTQQRIVKAVTGLAGTASGVEALKYLLTGHF